MRRGAPLRVLARSLPLCVRAPLALCVRARSLAVSVALVALTAALGATEAAATPDARAAAEIDYLLERVGSSSCTFIRGGDESDGPGARGHLERKYRVGRSRISSADEFVRHIASASSLTGIAYRVRCPQGESPAGTWLTRELERYRAGGAAATPR